ncbi:archease [Kitasatospora atroaurantiaca]|uniref:SHS2 domain-containing protein n=1 Tax=Kitasatospora atroaurantiaca TaxID=285545 RepID=A0A561ET86_9ACTN|nr:archease [Kitasatospora atroaurantiaca]TWE18836.1 SHS2 domain-containing protein [Kitasatospora atroaurantiaca]
MTVQQDHDQQPSSGHRSVPHTADLTIEAWAPTREECVAEAVRGMVGSFAEFAPSPEEPVTTTRECALTAETGEQLLVAVLEEVVYRMEAMGELPIEVVVTPTVGGALVRFTMVESTTAEQVGAVPKAVSLHGLRLVPGPHGWVCGVTLDV